MKDLLLPQTFLIMSFRYALNRNTAAPWEVSQYIKKYWTNLDKEFQRQIKEDIEYQIRVTEKETEFYNKISCYFLELLNWIDSQK